MDPISTAVLAGLAKLGEPAVKDAYAALKELIRRRFGVESRLPKAMDDLEADPSSEGRKIVLQEAVVRVSASTDSDIVMAASELLRRSGVPSGGNKVDVRGKGSIGIGGNVEGSTVVAGDRIRGGGS